MPRMGRPPRLTADQVQELRRRFGKGEQQKVLAKEFGVTPQIVHDAVRYKTWKVMD